MPIQFLQGSLLSSNNNDIDLTLFEYFKGDLDIGPTPPGLPIVQPYHNMKRKQLMAVIYNISDPNVPADVQTSHCISSDALEKLATEFRSRHAPNNGTLASLRSGQLLKNLQAAGVHVIVSSEQKPHESSTAQTPQ
ncbi:hypothetical protein EDB19DRAFT_2043647 [Suillus lakei]|nr:hypothetical protein EDB19DRAFT_2043647 [Suillus lakei]